MFTNISLKTSFQTEFNMKKKKKSKIKQPYRLRRPRCSETTEN